MASNDGKRKIRKHERGAPVADAPRLHAIHRFRRIRNGWRLKCETGSAVVHVPNRFAMHSDKRRPRGCCKCNFAIKISLSFPS